LLWFFSGKAIQKPAVMQVRNFVSDERNQFVQAVDVFARKGVLVAPVGDAPLDNFKDEITKMTGAAVQNVFEQPANCRPLAPARPILSKAQSGRDARKRDGLVRVWMRLAW
jgi:hypothetical protein